MFVYLDLSARANVNVSTVLPCYYGNKGDWSIRFCIHQCVVPAMKVLLDIDTSTIERRMCEGN